jgi:carbamoyl-phosphate synthase small subunit
VSQQNLPAGVEASHRSLFDGTSQGIVRTDCPAFSLQGHPEASPGPHDVGHSFDDFIAAMRTARH